MRRMTMLAALLLASTTTATFAAEPIEGNWQTASKTVASIAPCGGSYCVTLKTGTFAGKTIGKMYGSGASYSGNITDPETDKTYSGSATVSGNALKLKGCVLMVLCRSQTWLRM